MLSPCPGFVCLRSVLSICLALAASSMSFAAPSIGWGTSGQYLFVSPGDLVEGDRSPIDGWLYGGFVQLILVDTDGYNGFTSTGGDGTVGNDIIVDVSWVGRGASMSGDADDGRFYGQFVNTEYGPGSQFLVRFFSGPSAHWTGNVDSSCPVNGYLGISDVFVSTLALDSVDLEDFVIGSPVYTHLPEASSLLQMLTGAAALRVWRYGQGKRRLRLLLRWLFASQGVQNDT
ncbi:MAG: hypothetical protein KJ626_08740 [Verrucomicrobia bacterium]|nr:hypothetical protein [Verrucomicrobiota bacterium]